MSGFIKIGVAVEYRVWVRLYGDGFGNLEYRAIWDHDLTENGPRTDAPEGKGATPTEAVAKLVSGSVLENAS